MNNIVTLHSPVRSNPIPDQAAIHPGCRYDMILPDSALTEYLKHVNDADHDQQTGIVGAYRLSVDSAEIEPVDLSAQPLKCFVWDMDLLSPSIRRCLHIDPERQRTTHNNRLTLIDARLNAPEVCLLDNQPVLTISPQFELEWATEAFASQLGLVQLVQLVDSSRTVQFADGDARIIELMDYVVGTIHGQGYARIFTTDKFTPNPDDFEAVKAQGLNIVQQGFAVINEFLPAEGYAMGAFSIADAALFYVEFWADKTGITLPENCLKHYRLMLARPVVRRVLMEEGYRVD
ncbi:MAG: hypothetical protein WC685_13795 [Methylobacter sp.]|jgi:hypothetical protein